MSNPPFRKALVIGCPGSGKSFFSRKLSSITGIPCIHVDMLFWRPDKTHIGRAELIAKYDEVFARDSFLLDGNYIATLENKLQRDVDTVFFFDLPTDVCLEGIQERVGQRRDDMPFLETEEDGKELLEHVLRFEKDTKPLILEAMAKHPEIHWIRFGSRAEADSFLASLS